MKDNQLKILLILIITIPLFVIMVFSSSGVQSVSVAKGDAAAAYKAQCAACHSPKAEKAFDPAKPEEILVEIVLKGKKGEKPPYMPGFQAKGMTAEQAKELVVYMKQLRTPASTNTTPANTNVNANPNAAKNPNANANVTANSNANVDPCANVNANSAVNTPPNTNANTNVSPNITTVPDAKALAEAAAAYKTKCTVCHTAKVEKFFDAAKTDDQLIEAVLKGKKGAKPPFMPAFAEKGVTAEQAKALVYYMRQLKTSGK